MQLERRLCILNDDIFELEQIACHLDGICNILTDIELFKELNDDNFSNTLEFLAHAIRHEQSKIIDILRNELEKRKKISSQNREHKTI